MDEQIQLLRDIEAYCRKVGLAETTFGRRSVNDGKFVSRLREGKGVTIRTLNKVKEFIEQNSGPEGDDMAASSTATAASAQHKVRGGSATTAKKTSGKRSGATTTSKKDDSERAFRFYDNRQKYLMFVNTCDEKWMVSDRVGKELQHIVPTPPGLRVFDAGMGDGTVITNVMRNMHRRFPNVPFQIVGKEVSLEDVRLSLEKMPDRFYEHPASVMVITNMYYTEAPWLMPRSINAAAALNWHEISLTGSTAWEFDEQLKAMGPTLASGWQAKASEKTGNPLYVRPSVLVIFREDHRFLLDQLIPRPGQHPGQYDLVIASQPYRARMPAEFKVDKVLAPLAQSLGPGGRMVAVHSSGDDPGLEIVRKIWPDENPFITDRHTLLRVMKQRLAKTDRDLNFSTLSDKKAILQYHMHVLPNELGGASIGTSTLFAAWNAAIYVAQIEDARVEEAIGNPRYLEATSEVLKKHNGLWFNDEAFVISRRRS
ncbi:MAG TPA: hypothetical protein VKA19_07785 [Alphaproteobacteria bacterium]|nr:hypothetical protein [Alphaproteobacteria bacterium]